MRKFLLLSLLISVPLIAIFPDENPKYKGPNYIIKPVYVKMTPEIAKVVGTAGTAIITGITAGLGGLVRLVTIPRNQSNIHNEAVKNPTKFVEQATGTTEKRNQENVDVILEGKVSKVEAQESKEEVITIPVVVLIPEKQDQQATQDIVFLWQEPDGVIIPDTTTSQYKTPENHITHHAPHDVRTPEVGLSYREPHEVPRFLRSFTDAIGSFFSRSNDTYNELRNLNEEEMQQYFRKKIKETTGTIYTNHNTSINKSSTRVEFEPEIDAQKAKEWIEQQHNEKIKCAKKQQMLKKIELENDEQYQIAQVREDEKNITVTEWKRQKQRNIELKESSEYKELQKDNHKENYLVNNLPKFAQNVTDIVNSDASFGEKTIALQKAKEETLEKGKHRTENLEKEIEYYKQNGEDAKATNIQNKLQAMNRVEAKTIDQRMQAESQKMIAEEVQRLEPERKKYAVAAEAFRQNEPQIQMRRENKKLPKDKIEKQKAKEANKNNNNNNKEPEDKKKPIPPVVPKNGNKKNRKEEEQKNRKVNPEDFKQKTKQELKNDYETTKEGGLRLKDNGTPLRMEDGEVIHEIIPDYRHKDWECLDKNGKHIGCLDPVTKRLYKPAIPERDYKNGIIIGLGGLGGVGATEETRTESSAFEIPTEQDIVNNWGLGTTEEPKRESTALSIEMVQKFCNPFGAKKTIEAKQESSVKIEQPTVEIESSPKIDSYTNKVNNLGLNEAEEFKADSPFNNIDLHENLVYKAEPPVEKGWFESIYDFFTSGSTHNSNTSESRDAIEPSFDDTWHDRSNSYSVEYEPRSPSIYGGGSTQTYTSSEYTFRPPSGSPTSSGYYPYCPPPATPNETNYSWSKGSNE